MDSFDDRVVAITGGASGIGRALALECASLGADLSLVDVDGDGLAETTSRAERRGAEVESTQLDVSERDEVDAWAEETRSRFGRVDAIFNNAGVSLSATVEEVDYEDFEWLMDINFWGVVYGTKAFLPHLKAAPGPSRVVNVSSAYGLIASPTQGAYNAAKFAVRGFTEALRMELEIEGSTVGASCVHPGGVDTNIVRKGRFGETGELDMDPEETIETFEEEVARTTPEEAARTILDGVRRDKGRILVGADAMIVDVAQRLAPGSYPEPLARLIARWEGW